MTLTIESKTLCFVACQKTEVAGNGARKTKATFELLEECSTDELNKHLESLFQQGMSWDNYGEWHIDHIRPCASFDLTDFEQQKQCFHYSNLQPLWAADNFAKWL